MLVVVLDCLLHKYLFVLIVRPELLVWHLDEHIVIYFVRSATFKLSGYPAIYVLLLLLNGDCWLSIVMGVGVAIDKMRVRYFRALDLCYFDLIIILLRVHSHYFLEIVVVGCGFLLLVGLEIFLGRLCYIGSVLHYKWTHHNLLSADAVLYVFALLKLILRKSMWDNSSTSHGLCHWLHHLLII